MDDSGLVRPDIYPDGSPGLEYKLPAVVRPVSGDLVFPVDKVVFRNEDITVEPVLRHIRPDGNVIDLESETAYVRYVIRFRVGRSPVLYVGKAYFHHRHTARQGKIEDSAGREHVFIRHKVAGGEKFLRTLIRRVPDLTGKIFRYGLEALHGRQALPVRIIGKIHGTVIVPDLAVPGGSVIDEGGIVAAGQDAPVGIDAEYADGIPGFECGQGRFRGPVHIGKARI